MRWVQYKLIDLCNVITKGTTPSNIGESFSEFGINYIRSEMLTESKYINSNGLKYISPVTHEKLKRSQLNVGDILFSMAGVYLGKTALLREEDVPANTNQAVALIRVSDDKCNREYVYYYLNLPNVTKIVNSISGQAAQPNINLKQIGDIDILLPNRERQDLIVNFLSVYDDLIENNQRQIKLLEEATQRLYKEWFIDLHFPGNEETTIVGGIPNGWKRVPLKDVIGYEIGGGWGSEDLTKDCDSPAFVIRGTDLFGLTHGDFADIPYRFHGKSNLGARQLFDKDIIFEVSGGSKKEGVAKTALILQSLLDTLRSPVMCASFCKLIRARYKEQSQYLYDTFQYLRRSGKTIEFDKRSASSIVNYRWKDFLQQQEILIPEQSVLAQYNKLAENIYQKIFACSIQITQTKKARDCLLPKLMSGELEVQMDKKEIAQEDKFEYIRKHWQSIPYDEDLPLAARKTGAISEASLEKLRKIAEE